MPPKGSHKFTKARQDAYIEAVAERGASRASAAAQAGVGDETVRQFCCAAAWAGG